MSKHKQHGFAHLLLVLIFAVVVAAVGFAAWRVISNNGSGGGGTGPNYKALAACTDSPVLDSLPVDTTAFDQIVPLGNIGVPDHTLPTDHLYINFKQDGHTVPPVLNVDAPGNIVVTSI